MAGHRKILAFCLCALVATLGVVVDAGHGMMGGLLGGGGKHGGGYGGIEALLAAGLLAKLLRSHHGGGGGGHYGHERSAYEMPSYADASSYGLGMDMGGW